MRVYIKFFAVLLTAFTYFSISSPSAYAHAEILEAVPAINSQDNEVVSYLNLKFNEVVQTSKDQFSINDQAGRSVDFAFKQINSKYSEITLTPESSLKSGSYLVSYKIVSDDGHLVAGSYSFSINGSALIESASLEGAFSALIEYFTWIFLILAGALLFSNRVRSALAFAVLALLFSSLTFITIAKASGLSLFGTLSSVGAAMSAASLLISSIFLISAALVSRLKVVSYRFTVFAYLFFIFQGLFSGHHLLVSGLGRGVALLAHLIHLAAGAAWLGALIYLALEISKDRLVIVSKISTYCVYALVPSSLILSMSLTDYTLGDVWSFALVFKFAMVCFALILGYIHHKRVSESKSINRGSVLLEILFFIFIFAAASLLSNNTPAKFKSAPNSVTLENDAVRAIAVKDVINLDNGSYLNLSVDGKIGEGAVIMLDSYDARGAKLQLDSVELDISYMGSDGSSVTMTGAGYHFMGNHLFQASGRYNISVVAVVDGFTVLNGVVTVNV